MHIYHIPFVVRLFAEFWQFNCIKANKRHALRDLKQFQIVFFNFVRSRDGQCLSGAWESERSTLTDFRSNNWNVKNAKNALPNGGHFLFIEMRTLGSIVSALSITNHKYAQSESETVRPFVQVNFQCRPAEIILS